MRGSIVAYASVAVALALVLLLGIWGAYREMALVRSTLLRSEVGSLQAQAQRRAGHIEAGLDDSSQLPSREQLRKNPWFRTYWAGVRPLQENQQYAAIVDPSGEILLHTSPSLEGKKLGQRWYDRVVTEAGDEVVEIHQSLLAEGQHVFDIRIPLRLGGTIVGAYHEGLNADWLSEQVQHSRADIVQRWLVVIGGILAVVLVATVSLFRLARYSAYQRQLIDLAHMQRAAEIGQIGAGLAHEIRNPLHALRLNIHALGRSLGGGGKMGQDDLESLLRESNLEIDRVDRLMQELVGFTAPEQAQNQLLEVNSELQATVNFLAEEMRDQGIELRVRLSDRPLRVTADPNRLRQVFLNLLMNAKDAISSGGVIHVWSSHRNAQAEIGIADNGPGIAEGERERIFEPFYSTKKNGTGFGLALVKRYVEEAGGIIRCEAAYPQGTQFRILLPLVRRNAKERSKE